MGMFDWINYKCDCPECGNLLNEFQSQDGNCLLAKLEPKDVENFYNLCDNCNAWIEYEVVNKEPLELKLISKEK